VINPRFIASGSHLGELFAPEDLKLFLGHCWPSLPYHARQRSVAADALSHCARFEDSEDLLSTYSGRVSLLHPDGRSGDCPGGPEAVEAYRSGMTCYLRHVEEQFTETASIVRSVAAGLGLPKQFVVSEVFCSSGSSGVAMHSDYDVNFALLVRGEKAWRVARNTFIENQPGVCLGGPFQPDRRVRHLVSGMEMPTRLPLEAQLFNVSAGELLFLPRGWWHETQARGDCFQVNFVVKGPQYATLALEALENFLLSRSEWRGFAFGVAAPDSAPHVQAILISLLSNVRAEMMQYSDMELATAILADQDQ
jgi:50S ribosomal protein L16 3-hydroxylase